MHVLQNGTATLGWAYFESRGKDKMRVTALIGASQYIDREMPIAEARDTYKRLRTAGWQKRDAAKAPPIQNVRFYIYD